MSEVREAIALKVQAGGPVSLTGEEAVDVLRMIHELGKFELAAINHAKDAAANAEVIAARDRDLAALRDLLARDRRSLWDTFAAAGLGSGKDVESAASQADRMMIRREGRRA